MRNGMQMRNGLLSGFLVAAASATPSRGQTDWAISFAGATQSAEAFADRSFGPIPDCAVAEASLGLTPGLLHADLGGHLLQSCDLTLFTCPLRGRGISQVTIRGAGTDTIRIRWHAIAKGFNNCANDLGPKPYRAFGVADLDADLELKVNNVPIGVPIDVYWMWNQFAFNNFKPEDMHDDPASVSGELMLNGVAQYNQEFDLADEPGTRRRSQSGVLTYIGGTFVTVDVTACASAEINDPGVPVDPPTYWEDLSSVAFQGELILSIVPIAGCLDPEVEFSLDIGSDCELSDDAGGNEVFDPGDAYLWQGPALPAGGADGIKDDGQIFVASDYAPAPNDPASAAPVCSNLHAVDVIPEWFDMDGHDSVDFDLSVTIPPGQALADPIDRFPSDCVLNPDYLVISLDDDRSGHYVGSVMMGCEVPVTSSSAPPPFPVTPYTYGTAAGDDEVLGVNLVSGLFSPYSLGPVYPVLSESNLHQSLGPDPDASEDADDDVDALDVFGSTVTSCNFWLLSPDHEATGRDFFNNEALEPGAIYQVEVTGPVANPAVKIIDAGIHLGLQPGVDIDAFEFAWVFDPASGGEVLTLLFSVDDDDPLTADVESGGLDPAMIYGSHLTGSSFALLDDPLLIDIDSLAAWCDPLVPQTPPPCFADVTGDGVVDVQDLVEVVLNWLFGGGSSDINGDGIVNVQDLVLVILNWGPCP